MPANAKMIRTNPAVIEAFLAIMTFFFFLSFRVIVKKTEAVLIGFTMVNSEEKQITKKEALCSQSMPFSETAPYKYFLELLIPNVLFKALIPYT